MKTSTFIILTYPYFFMLNPSIDEFAYRFHGKIQMRSKMSGWAIN